jgi:hypothetical protein
MSAVPPHDVYERHLRLIRACVSRIPDRDRTSAVEAREWGEEFSELLVSVLAIDTLI